MASKPRGYFGIGVEGIHKGGNVGNLVRSAHAFGASFFFTISPALDVNEVKSSDTSGAFEHLPYYEYQNFDDYEVPKGCQLVGVELVENAIELPSFRHPSRAAYILGPEMGDLSPETLAKCDHVIKIPMSFCINVGVAGALVMYDRVVSNGRFMPRPVMAGGPQGEMPKHIHGHRKKQGGDWLKTSKRGLERVPSDQ